MNNRFCIENTDLASRRTAAVLRARVQEALNRYGRASIDFAHVVSVSESYADELFGVLVEENSLAWVFSRLSIDNASKDVLNTLSSAIRYRLVHRIAKSDEAALGLAQEALKARTDLHASHQLVAC